MSYQLPRWVTEDELPVTERRWSMHIKPIKMENRRGDRWFIGAQQVPTPSHWPICRKQNGGKNTKGVQIIFQCKGSSILTLACGVIDLNGYAPSMGGGGGGGMNGQATAARWWWWLPVAKLFSSKTIFNVRWRRRKSISDGNVSFNFEGLRQHQPHHHQQQQRRRQQQWQH